MENMPLVSVVIPVHNGAKYVKRVVKGILNQTYKNLEVILVENFSTDNSLDICKALEKEDKRVHTYQSFKRGTSLARRVGIEAAKGKYITFSDQDDRYIDNKSIENMCKAIMEDKAQVVQFGSYKEFRFGIKKKVSFVENNCVFDRKELLDKEIRGLFSDKNAKINMTVWSKIFDADVLKEAVKDITETMYFAEDMYLCSSFFLNPKVKLISSRAEYYYVWNAGVGFSSGGNGKSLIEDYEKLKPFVIKYALEQGINEEMLFQYHLETVYLHKSVIVEMILKNEPKKEIEKLIKKYSSYKFIIEAKQYFNNYPDKEKIWEELIFLASDYSPEDYYDYCNNHLPKMSFKQKLFSLIRR